MPISTVSRRALRTGAAIISAGAVAAGVTLVASPAHANVEYGRVSSGGYVSTGGTPTSGTCTAAALPASTSKEIRDNNVAVTHSQSDPISVKWSGSASDIISGVRKSTITGRITPITANGGKITMSGNASISAKPALTASKCQLSGTAYSYVDMDVVLPVGMWVTATSSASVRVGGSFEFGMRSSYSAGSKYELESRVGGNKSRATVTDYLPAGTYLLGGEISADGRTNPTYSTAAVGFAASARGNATVTFRPGGAPSAVTGKGAKYVAPGARSCRSGWVNASVTKAGKKAKKVVFKVNGRTVQTLKGKKLKKASTVTLGGAGLTSAANVSATITTKKGKKVTVTRSYLACR